MWFKMCCSALRCGACRKEKEGVARVCVCWSRECKSCRRRGAEKLENCLLPEQEGSVERESHTSIESSKWHIPTREEHKRVARDAQRWKRRCRLQQTGQAAQRVLSSAFTACEKEAQGSSAPLLAEPTLHQIVSLCSNRDRASFRSDRVGDIHAQRFNLTTRVHLFSLLSPSPFGGADRSHFTQFNVTFLRVSSAFAGSRTCSSQLLNTSLCQRERTAGDSPTPTYGPDHARRTANFGLEHKQQDRKSSSTADWSIGSYTR